MSEITVATSIEDLLPGDVLLFSYEQDDVISKAIALVTNSDVSHAAMYYSACDQTIVEETPPDAQFNLAAERFKDRTIYVRRYHDFTPLSDVIEAAKKYVSEKAPYSPYADLFLLGIVLLYEKLTEDNILNDIIAQILELCCEVLVDWINNKKYPGQDPMVCSQFVAQCYQDGKLALRFDDKKLKGDAQLSVLDYVITKVKPELSKRVEDLIQQPPVAKSTQDPKTLAKKLIDRLKNLGDRTDYVTSDEAVSDRLVAAVVQFASLYYKLGKTTTLTSTEHIKAENVLAVLKEKKPLFVTPADLKDNCSSLRDIGTIPPDASL